MSTNEQERLVLDLRAACMNVRRKTMPLVDLIPLLQKAADALEVAVLTAEQPQSDVQRDAERALIAELRDALVGLDEAYCRAGSPLTRDERFEDRKRLIAARSAVAKAKERT